MGDASRGFPRGPVKTQSNSVVMLADADGLGVVASTGLAFKQVDFMGTSFAMRGRALKCFSAIFVVIFTGCFRQFEDGAWRGIRVKLDVKLKTASEITEVTACGCVITQVLQRSRR